MKCISAVVVLCIIISMPCLADNMEYDWLSPLYHPFLTHTHQWQYSWIYPIDRPYVPYYDHRYSAFGYGYSPIGYRYILDPSYLTGMTFDPAAFGIDPWWDVNVYGLRGVTIYYTTPPAIMYSRGGYSFR